MLPGFEEPEIDVERLHRQERLRRVTRVLIERRARIVRPKAKNGIKSDFWIFSQIRLGERSELYQEINQIFKNEYGIGIKEKWPNIDLPCLGATYVCVRKNEHKKLKLMCKGIEPEPDLLPEEEVALYAVLVDTQIGENIARNIIKLGFTRSNVYAYVKKQYRGKKPRLLAKKSGTEDQEDKLKEICKPYLADGEEYFYPVPAVFDCIKENLELEENAYAILYGAGINKPDWKK